MKRYIFLIFTIFTLLFTGCNNLFENNSIESEKTSESDGQDASSRIVTISGSINAGGAYPAEIAAALESRQAEFASRTAYPSLPATDLTIDVNAETTTTPKDSYKADVDWTTKTYTIGIPLSASGAKNYQIKASIKYNNAQILYGESEAFDISLTTPLASEDLTVAPTQTGNGTVKLEIESESGSTIAKCKTSLSGDTVFTFLNNKTLIDIGSVSSGNQVIKIDFFDSSDKLLYSFHESVNMFDNLQTNTWVKFGTEPWLVVENLGGSQTTKCRITNAMVEGFKLTEIYVDPAATTTTQSGTFINPCLSLSTAISKLNYEDKDYKIYIKGSLTGPQEIPDTLTDTSEGSYHAKSVTIIGYNGLDENGVPKDSLNGGFTSAHYDGVTLKINSSVPVIIKNLMITGGNNNGDGGGIYSTGKLTLDSGAFVCGNITDTCGGGVMNNGGELTIKSGAVIANNTSSGTNNNAYGGGGVYNYNGTLVMSGGQIKSNTAKNGGGIYSIIDDQTELTVVYIYGDSVIGGDTTADRNSAVVGGGIYNHGGLIYFGCTGYSASVEENSTAYYNPDTSKSVAWTGKISHNSATQLGGGIYSQTSLSVSTSKGTGLMFVLSGTISSNSASNGGGVFFQNGSQFTLYGGKIGGDTSADGNTATAVGGGINAQGKCYLKGGTVSYNTASDGGGIYAANGPIISSGTIKNNSATFNGGAIYVNAMCTYLGDAYIPVGSDKKNDVYIYTANSACITLSDLNPPAECTDGIVATITPGSYSSGTTVVTFKDTVTEEQKPGLVSKFAVKQDSSTPNTFWKINSSGNLESSILVSADNAASVIQAMTASGSVTITGSISDEQFTAIAEKVKNLGTGVNINLDLSQTDLTSIPDDLFTGADKLTAITFPSTLENIGESSFKNCRGLTSITIPDSVTMVRNSAFDGCENISSYTLPNNDSVVYQNKIFGGWDLTELVVTKGSMTGSAVIANIESLYTVTLPANLGNYPIFYNCPNVRIIHYLGTRAQWESKCSTWFSNNSPSLLDLTTITFIDD